MHRDPTSRTYVKLVLSKGEKLDEFRCGSCGAMLLKGRNLEKAMIEVKCRRCGTLVINPG